MNFDDPAVQRMLAVGDSSAETRVVDTGGMILLSNDKRGDRPLRKLYR